MPVVLVGVGGVAAFPAVLTVLFAQGHVQDALFMPGMAHLLDPGPQVGEHSYWQVSWMRCCLQAGAICLLWSQLNLYRWEISLWAS